MIGWTWKMVFSPVERQGKRVSWRVLNRTDPSLVDPFTPRTPWGISVTFSRGEDGVCGTGTVDLVLVATVIGSSAWVPLSQSADHG